VLSNDSDPDGDPLTITSVSPVTGGGSASLNGSTISFTPGASAGIDSFSYTVSDGKGGTDTAIVRVKVTAPVINLPPIAKFDSCNQALGVTTFTCDLIGNDSDPEGDPISVTGFSASSDAPGGILAATLFNGVLSLTVDPLLPQTITISYTLSDGTHSVTGSAGAKIA
jgi:large repetitive protein